MKSVKSMVLGVFVIGIFVSLSSISFADQAHKDAKIKLLNDSAAALLQSNPKISADLTAYSNEETAEKNELPGEKNLDMTKRTEHIKIVREAAGALEKSNPDLAKSLTNMADRHEKMMKDEKEKEPAKY